MVPNNHTRFSIRCNQLITAVKLVYASDLGFMIRGRFLSGTAYRIRRDQMAVIIQQLVGSRYGSFFYPGHLRHCPQSHNFYPVAPLKAEDGVARIVMGFGRGIPEGDPSLRFSPHTPRCCPSFSKIEDILANAQRQFWALAMENVPDSLYL